MTEWRETAYPTGWRVEFWADGNGAAMVQVTDEAGVIFGQQQMPADFLRQLASPAGGNVTLALYRRLRQPEIIDRE